MPQNHHHHILILNPNKNTIEIHHPQHSSLPHHQKSNPSLNTLTTIDTIRHYPRNIQHIADHHRIHPYTHHQSYAKDHQKR